MRPILFVLIATASLSLAPLAAHADSGKARAFRRVDCMKASGAKSGCTGFHLRQRKTQPADGERTARTSERADGTSERKHAPPAPDPSVDPRARLARREQRLLMHEIAQLQRLFGSMRRKDPQRAQVLRRLAESYAELARASERRAAAAEIEAEAAEKKPRQKPTPETGPTPASEPRRQRPRKRSAPPSPYPTRL